MVDKAAVQDFVKLYIYHKSIVMVIVNKVFFIYIEDALCHFYSWNEWLKLPMKYQDLPRNAQVHI